MGCRKDSRKNKELVTKVNSSNIDSINAITTKLQMIEIIDTHCHLDNSLFNHDLDNILLRCHATGISKIIVPAITSGNWDTVLALCDQYDELYPALGLHPLYCDQHLNNDIYLLDDYLSHHAVVAVGEIGLDYYDKNANREKQLTQFEQQLKLAEKFELPVLLHARKSHSDILKCLKKYTLVGGISHAFNGSLEQADEYIKLGFKLGLGAVMTYEKATKIRRLATELPLHSIVLETDAPDMSGYLHQGERNSPEYLHETLSVLADLRGQDIHTIAKQTTQNSYDVFAGRLDDSTER